MASLSSFFQVEADSIASHRSVTWSVALKLEWDQCKCRLPQQLLCQYKSFALLGCQYEEDNHNCNRQLVFLDTIQYNICLTLCCHTLCSYLCIELFSYLIYQCYIIVIIIMLHCYYYYLFYFQCTLLCSSLHFTFEIHLPDRTIDPILLESNSGLKINVHVWYSPKRMD